MKARITVYGDKIIGKINPNIFGHFIEHLGRCIYGGIYEPGSPLADSRGYRLDVVDAVKRIGCPILRWPGGNFASNYHWEDGIGPLDRRPVRTDLAWLTEEPNTFGTDEFIEFCRLVGAEPYICLNIGTGSLDEAIHWLEYCNSNGQNEYAKLRRKYGHSEPFRVRYWGVGNETYGSWQVGSSSAKEYAKKLREYARLMKAVDPTIRIVAVGADDPRWDFEVITTAGDYIDYISHHQYHGSDDYYLTVGSVHYVEKRLNILKATILAASSYLRGRQEPIKISFDEWNIWYRGRNNGLEENYALKDGLFAARIFHVMFRMCADITMANLAQLVNVLGAIHTEKHGLYVTAVYKAFELYALHRGDTVVETVCESPTFDASGVSAKHTGSEQMLEIKGAPFVDAVCSLDRNTGRLYLSIINYHLNEEAEVSFRLLDVLVGDKARVYELNADDVFAVNDFETPDRVTVSCREEVISKECPVLVVPPHSATVFEFELENAS